MPTYRQLQIRRVSLPLIVLLGLVACTLPRKHVLSDEVSQNRQNLVDTNSKNLTRAEFLAIFVGGKIGEPNALLQALSSDDPMLRMVAALHLGELGASQLSATVVQSLARAVADPDQHVSEQAVASLIRIGGSAPNLLLSLLDNVTPSREVEYWSDSADAPRRMKVSPSDIAITALFLGHSVKLDQLAAAYETALTKVVPPLKTVETSAQETSPTEADPVEIGSPEYYSLALSMLLRRFPDFNEDLIEKLIQSTDQRMRSTGYAGAAKVTTNSDSLTDVLSRAVRVESSKTNLSAAADALRMRGKLGRTVLVEMTEAGNADVRAAAIGALLAGENCDSPFRIVGLSDSEPKVREAVLETLLAHGVEDANLQCLAPSITDNAISKDLRGWVARRMSWRTGQNGGFVNQKDIDSLVAVWRPVLSSNSSPVYFDAWETIGALLNGSRSSNRAIALTAMASIRGRPGAIEEGLICATASLEPEILAGEKRLLRRLLLSIDGDYRNCLSSALMRLNTSGPAEHQVAKIVVDELLTKRSLSKTDVELLDKLMPSEQMVRTWRNLARRNSGVIRIAIYRMVASRGVSD